MRVLARDILQAAKERPNETIEAMGWIHRVRELGAITFVVLRDRSGLVQLVLSDSRDTEGSASHTLSRLNIESVIKVRGKAALNPKAPGGAEIAVESLECISEAMPDIPFQVNGDISKVGLESILDNRTLSLRNPKIRSIFKVQATIIQAFSDYLRSQDFTEIKSTKLVMGSTEGGTNLFPVEYFDKQVFLAQSPQFYKQTMVSAGMERVFEVAQAYRAEKHDTPRHLNEYVSLDLEMGFIESEKDLIDLEKKLLAYIFEELIRRNSEDFAAWNATVPAPESVDKAPTIPHDDCLQIVNEEIDRSGSGSRAFDINPEAERILCEYADKEYGIPLIFVNQFPRRHRPFYTFPLDLGDGSNSSTMSFDALFRGLEITSGSRRQNDYQAQLEVLPRFGLDPKNMEGYLSIFKYGCPPHGGFAIGCERLTARLLGLANVKEASLFPRDRKRVEP